MISERDKYLTKDNMLLCDIESLLEPELMEFKELVIPEGENVTYISDLGIQDGAMILNRILARERILRSSRE